MITWMERFHFNSINGCLVSIYETFCFLKKLKRMQNLCRLLEILLKITEEHNVCILLYLCPKIWIQPYSAGGYLSVLGETLNKESKTQRCVDSALS